MSSESKRVTYDPASALSLNLAKDGNALLFSGMLSNNWVDFPGDYLNTFYDVELVSGEVLSRVRPIDHTWGGYPEEQVKRIRFSIKPYIVIQLELLMIDYFEMGYADFEDGLDYPPYRS